MNDSRIQKQVCSYQYLVGTSEAAAILGMTYWSILKLIHDQRIEATKINGRWKIPIESIDAFINSSPDYAAFVEQNATRMSAQCSNYLYYKILKEDNDE